MKPRIFLFFLLGLGSLGAEKNDAGTVVLTFDDSVASQATFVAPLLKKYGFGATFSSPRALDSPRTRRTT